ncbi:MAG: hypothetical protein Q9165_004673 [Trypethelium subeluteriae]
MDVNEKDQTVILHLNPYQALKEGKFVILRISPSTAEHPNGSAETVQLGCLRAPEEDGLVNGQEFSEVAFNARHQRSASFPGEFHEHLRVGETYQFFWPGGEISEWEYGTISERRGQKAPDAPILSLSMQAGPSLHLDGYYDIKAKLTYEASEVANGKSITLYLADLRQIEYGGSCCLIHYSERGLEWVQPDYVLSERYEREDKPIGEDDRFVTLFPGNGLEFDIELYPENHERDDFEPGHRYSYRFNGKVVDWWDWGTREDHRNTLVGIFPDSHSQRPDIVIPEVSVDFSVEP